MDILFSNLFFGGIFILTEISGKNDSTTAEQLTVALVIIGALGPELMSSSLSMFIYLWYGIGYVWLRDRHYVSTAIITLIYGRNFYLLSKAKCLLYHLIPRFCSDETVVDLIVEILSVSNDVKLYLNCIISYSPHILSILFIQFVVRDHLPFGRQVPDDFVKISTIYVLIGLSKSIESLLRIALRIESGVIEIIQKPMPNSGFIKTLCRFSYLRWYRASQVQSIPTTFGPITCMRDDLRSWYYIKEIGKGSFGSVFEGRSYTGLSFALKEVEFGNPHFIFEVEKEILALSNFSHDNIVKYYGAKRSDSFLYIFLELVDGGSLQRVYKERKGPFSNSEISKYTRQILNGLIYLHERNIIHRDIKCANILINSSKHVKLADFGISRVIKPNDLIQTYAGTWQWMAPEVERRQPGGYGIEADIWSVGCTVLEMSTARIPYKTRGEDLPEIPEYLSDDLKDFIGQCLQKDPSRRPNAAELLNHALVKE